MVERSYEQANIEKLIAYHQNTSRFTYNDEENRYHTFIFILYIP